MSEQGRREVERMARTIAADVYALENATINALLPSLLAAREQLHRDLTLWLRKANGAERFTAQQYRRALAAIEAALGEIARLRPELEARIVAAAATGANLAAGHLRDELVRFSRQFGESIRPTQISTAAIIAATRHEIIPRIRTSSARYVQAVREDMRHQFAIGLAAGETFEQLTNRLRRLGGPRGLVALRGIVGEPGAHVEDISEGLFTRYRHWAERVVRTEVINAYNVEHVAAIELANADLEDGDEPLVLRWDSTPDKRRCKICRQLDGKTAEVGKKFPDGYDKPPAHPNCRCVAIAWHPSWGTLPGELGAPKPDKSRKSPAQRQLPGIPAAKPKQPKQPKQRKPRAAKPAAPIAKMAPAAAPPPPPPPPPKPPAPPPAPPAAPPAARTRRARGDRPSDTRGRRALEQRQISQLQSLSSTGAASGVNSSFVATLDDGTRAIWKPITGESRGLRSNIKAGTYYQREAAASAVADMLGVSDLLPAAVTTTHNGVPGSIQAWAEGAVPLRNRNGTTATPFDRDSSERMRVFDFIVGNTDRHYGNALQIDKQGRSLPVLIDHGLSFPNGPPARLLQPWRCVSQATGNLLPETQAQIADVNLRKLAKALHESNIEEAGISHTLYRARYLQLHPHILEVPNSHDYENSWNDIAQEAHRRLDPKEKKKIDALVAKVRKKP